MKLIEKYLMAIGAKLPLRTREDVKAELRSLLLDDIEAKYGPDPSDEQVRGAIETFGSPGAVAARYAGARSVIGTGFTDLYFLVVGIMFGAMAIAFTTVQAVELVQHPVSGWPLAQAILTVPWRTLMAGLTGMGWVTVAFIILSRVAKDPGDLVEDGWSVKELDEVKLDTELQSRLESVIGIVFQAAAVIVLVAFPGIVTAAERLFSLSTIPLGHEIVVPVFRWYALVLAALTLGEIVNHLAAIRAGTRSPENRLVNTVLSGANALVLVVMLLDGRLYANDTGFIGFKLIFGIVLIVSLVEMVSGVVKAVRARVAGANT